MVACLVLFLVECEVNRWFRKYCDTAWNKTNILVVSGITLAWNPITVLSRFIIVVVVSVRRELGEKRFVPD